MSLQQLFLILKGSDRSGHWAHAGRIGKVGGSSSGGGLSLLGLSRESDKKQRQESSNRLKDVPKLDLKTLVEKDIISYTEGLDKDEEGKKVIQYANALSSFRDKSGLNISDITVTKLEYQIRVSGVIKNNDGKNVGDIIRDFIPKNKKVHHLLLELKEEERNTGFGSRLYFASEKAYQQMGYEKITLNANLNVGGYAWARMGYTFLNPIERDDITNNFSKYYKEKFDQNIPKKPTEAYEIAAYLGPNGERIGKEFLLGKYWSAEKNLKTNDKGYQIGLEYYRQKDLL